jgi:DedD protein
MEVRVRERLIGALVLVAIVVLVVPAILKGRDPAPAALPESVPTRRVEVPIGNPVPVPEEQVLVPEPDPQPEPKAASRESTEAPPAPAPEPAPAPAPVKAGPAAAWAVQLGAFSSRAKADQLVAELRKRRYAAFVLEYRASGQVLYRVRVGPEQDRKRAEEIAARLAKDGFQTVVARHP